MRAPPAALLVALLLAGTGLAAAQSPGPDGSGSPSAPAGPEQRLRECLEDAEGADDERACHQAYCRERPAEPRCRPGETPRPSPTRHPDPPCAFDGSGCRGEDGSGDGDADDGMGDSGDGRRGGLHVSFEGELASLSLTTFAVDGVVVLDRVEYVGAGEADLERERGSWTVEVGDDVVRLHDNPTGLLGFKAGEDGAGAFRIDLADGAVVERHGEEARVRLGDRVAFLVAPGASWDGDNVTSAGFLSFHLAPPERPGPPEDRHEEREERVRDAIERRHVGAEVAVRLRDARQAGGPVEVTAFDDVEVEVAAPDGPATRGSPIRLVVSADLAEGRTIVVRLDGSVLVGDELDLHYYDLHGDGSETEVVFRRASGLADVLDPTDDGGQPEYWVVEDEDGLQAMVSVPHWSAHAITLASLEEAAPSILVGVAAGIAGTALAAGFLLWPRRRRGDEA